VIGVRAAATVMLVRDRPGLEVLLLRRTPTAVFGPGATVFPGGAVDPGDADVGSRVRGLDDGEASAEQGLAMGGLAFRVAAVRECFEEAGVLLARDRDGHSSAGEASWRDALNAGHATFAHMLEQADVHIDARDLMLFAHWLTPLGAPRRYDTWFFIARAPEDQEPLHDDVELVESGWLTPLQALSAYRRGEIELIFPTLRSLLALARFETTRELFDALEAVPHDGAGRPLVVSEGSGERVALPGDELHDAYASWTIPLPDFDWRVEAELLGEDLR
jgi:8-oxo-dGTP pyrophosphatase MutT (NUDIX family)